MPPKKPAAPSKKVEQKKKEKVIEVSFKSSTNQQKCYHQSHMFYF